MKRNDRRYGCALILLIPLSIPSVLSADALAQSQARFAQVHGTVQVLSPGAVEWIDAHTDLPLESGDQIRVGDDGEAEISASQNALWIVQSGSEVVWEHSTSDEGFLTLSQGSLEGKVSHDEVPQHWEFHTPTAVCAVRGTEFALDVSALEGAHLGVFDGEVEMKPIDSEEAPYVIHASEEGILRAGHPFQKCLSFTERMRRHAAHRNVLQQRHAAMQSVWTPLTTQYRQELRSRFVKPPPPPRKSIHRQRKRRSPSSF